MSPASLRIVSALYFFVAARSSLNAWASDADALIASPDVKSLQMKFLHAVSAIDSNKGWDLSFQENSGASSASCKAQILDMEKWMPDLEEGDFLSFDFDHGEVTMRFNGSIRGKLKSSDFARLLLSTWIGKKPPTEELKRGLLGIK